MILWVHLTNPEPGRSRAGLEPQGDLDLDDRPQDSPARHGIRIRHLPTGTGVTEHWSLLQRPSLQTSTEVLDAARVVLRHSYLAFCNTICACIVHRGVRLNVSLQFFPPQRLEWACQRRWFSHLGHRSEATSYNYRSSLRYWIASATWSALMCSSPAGSAIAQARAVQPNCRPASSPTTRPASAAAGARSARWTD